VKRRVRSRLHHPPSRLQFSAFSKETRERHACGGASRLPKVTGESSIGGLVGRLDEFLSAPWRLGVLRGPVKKRGLLPRSPPALQASKNVAATNSFFCYEGRRSGAVSGIGWVFVPKTAAPPGVSQICAVKGFGKLIFKEPAPHTCSKIRSVHGRLKRNATQAVLRCLRSRSHRVV